MKRIIQILTLCVIASLGGKLSAQTDVTNTYILNADLASTSGWTEYASSEFHDLGNGLVGTYQVNQKPAAAIDGSHLDSDYCLGFECRWEGNYASYEQTLNSLPAGSYKLIYDVQNTNSSTANQTYDNLFYVQVDESKIIDSSVEWMIGESGWKNHIINFEVPETSNVKISLGYGTIDNTPGGETPALYVSHLKLLQFADKEARLAYEYNKPDEIPQDQQLISVDLLEAGSLGTEVLYYIDNIRDVKYLRVKGLFNDDDWGKLNMMQNLVYLDLEHTDIKEIPREQFLVSKFPYLSYIKIPETLEVIGYRAFMDTQCCSEFVFPASLKTIAQEAFMGSNIKEVILPESVTDIGEEAFYGCKSLTKAIWPASVETIARSTFQDCTSLRDLTLPEGLKNIAIWGLRNIQAHFTLPSTLESIGEGACVANPALGDTLIIPDNCISIGDYAFADCEGIKCVELPVGLCEVNNRDVFTSWHIETIVIKSPTILQGTRYTSIVRDGRKGEITLKVPSYLVNAYKLDSYWYTFKAIEGFSTSTIQDWVISKPLTLNGRDRLEGTPNLTMNRSGSLKIVGDAPMTINNLFTCKDWNIGAGWNTMIISSCDNVSIQGEYEHRIYTPAKRWVFICLPFDTKVGDIRCGSNFAIRFYDGANRAENGTGGNWKDYDPNDVIPAGTGFIIQTSSETSTWFKALENSAKQFVVSNNEFVKALAVNDSESAANKGWNLVGNPWLSYYNIHKLNFTAPITVWNVDSRNYTAYSIIDDDYAIEPNQAFFVQCPDEINSITFPVDGRQLTNVIESQNGVKTKMPQAQTRHLIDIELSDGELTDKTRFVLNEQASKEYEVNYDASKFFSMDNSVPQIYSIENDTPLAINERPMAEGIVKICIKVSTNGCFNLSALRNQFSSIILVDKETGSETDLTVDSYSFTANAGIYEDRFELKINNNSVETGIQAATSTLKSGQEKIYNVSGQQISHPRKGVYIVNGLKVVLK